MKAIRNISICILLIVAALVSSCQPSPSAIQTPVAQTLTALPTFTPYPTYTPYPTFTPLPSFTPTITSTATPDVTSTPVFAKWTIKQAESALYAAGAEYVSPSSMGPSDYGMAPMVASEAIHFLVPSLCSDCGGRLYSFSTPGNLAAMRSYYVSLGQQSAAFFSWVYVKDNILIQINGEYPEDLAKVFKRGLDNMK
ncbi:MAG TPA: hypothetical protein DIW44_12365 [Anaerolineaceae bacterium]|nr:hypothetical protein [Anaerolineaceae bacterium]